MGLLSKLLKEKKSYASVLINTQNTIFGIYGVTQPTDAQKMKASVYLCITGIAILNDLGGGGLRRPIDRLVEETKELTKPLSMRIEELSNSNEELEDIISEMNHGFSENDRDIGSTMTNGLGAFEALYFSKIEGIMERFAMCKDAPMGIPGYAPHVVIDGTLGKGKGREHFMDVVSLLSDFQTELVEVTKLNKEI